MIEMLAVHVALDRYGRTQSAISDALMRATNDRGALIIDFAQLGKHLAPWSNPRRAVDIDVVDPALLPQLVARDGVVFVATLDRDDSAFHVERNLVANSWRAKAASHCVLETAHDQAYEGMRLRVFRIEKCG